MVKILCTVSTLGGIIAQQAGTQTPENHPSMSFSECTSSGCQSKAGQLTIDANWRWIHEKGTTTNCYTGNKWDTTICSNPTTCSANCVVEGADSEYTSTYGVTASGNQLEIDFVTQGPYSKNIGARTYLMDSESSYMMFKLKNKEFTYTVDDSNMGCGINGALYFVQMEKDGGKAKYGHAGAKYGLGYCDAQCPHDVKFINGEANSLDWKPSQTDQNSGSGKYGSCCTEIDIWEANRAATAFTMHACDGNGTQRCSGTECGDNGADRFRGVCDKNGCDMQSHRLGNAEFYGAGSQFKVDSTQSITVTTQFITSDGTDSGTLSEVKQFYTQNGKTIEHPDYTVNGNQHKSITDDYCNDWVAETKDGTQFEAKGGLKTMERALEAGVVLVMSLWDDHNSNMLWLDSTYPAGSTSPGSVRGTCATSSGVPADVESQDPNSHVIFSDIKYGAIGSTISGPTPAPSPTPTPSPSDCPGGSLSACIGFCPSDIFQICLAECEKRCVGEIAV